MRAALLEQPPAPGSETEISKGAEASFPLKARDLMPDLQGPDLGKAMKRLEGEWIASGFTLSRDELIARAKG